MDYLTQKILMRPNEEYLEIYNFIRDRGRALRKDFKIQNHLKGADCVNVLERLTRFLIHSDFVLNEEPESRYSWKQNRHQISDTLSTLMEIYDDESQQGIRYPQEAEFRSYYVLLTIDDPVPIHRMQSWRREVIQHTQVQTALFFHRAFQNKQFQYFFAKLRESRTTYLMACILQIPFLQMRRDAFKCLNASLTQRDKPFPLELLGQVLALSAGDETRDYCQYWGFEVVQDPEVGYQGVVFGRKDASRPNWIGSVFDPMILNSFW
jgi:hypothetical protein